MEPVVDDYITGAMCGESKKCQYRGRRHRYDNIDQFSMLQFEEPVIDDSNNQEKQVDYKDHWRDVDNGGWREAYGFPKSNIIPDTQKGGHYSNK